ncbi:hypothetical protein [Streptomyces sp. ITFR-6]|uniref:hypothetical protein n=1 Tax=Streptomyces sp. ITFR-6 TaxID=3075197 RepID=UPI00288A9191|nr:hypothetical protein [Streptomyces sp. ITFR-6]WNI30772.1 hypothetical protein RLT59_19785 [Streptomyces sp. ITFR-6]
MTRFLDLVRPAAGTALMSEWLTGTAERSRLAADTVVGLLAAHVHLTPDGEQAMVVAEWTDAAHEAASRHPASGGVGRRRYTLHHAFEDDLRESADPKGTPGSAR